MKNNINQISQEATKIRSIAHQQREWEQKTDYGRIKPMTQEKVIKSKECKTCEAQGKINEK